LILEGKVVGRESARGWVVDQVTHALLIGRIFTAAVDPNLILVGLTLDVVFQVLRHLLRQIVWVVVEVVVDAEDPVQLEENAGLSDVEAVSIGITGAQSAEVKVTSIARFKIGLNCFGAI